MFKANNIEQGATTVFEHNLNQSLDGLLEWGEMEPRKPRGPRKPSTFYKTQKSREARTKENESGKVTKKQAEKQMKNKTLTGYTDDGKPIYRLKEIPQKPRSRFYGGKFKPTVKS